VLTNLHDVHGCYGATRLTLRTKEAAEQTTAFAHFAICGGLAAIDLTRRHKEQSRLQI
jgi:hypothetical protein